MNITEEQLRELEADKARLEFLLAGLTKRDGFRVDRKYIDAAMRAIGGGE